MLIGLMSDTHDNVPMVHEAVEAFNTRNVDLVLHAGDYVAPFIIPALSRLKCPLIGVFGNNDGDRVLLTAKFSEHEHLDIRGSFALISVDDMSIALLHGDNRDLLQALIARETFDIVVHGHTHIAAISHHGKTLIVNPGEVCGYLTGKATIALLDTDTKWADLHSLR